MRASVQDEPIAKKFTFHASQVRESSLNPETIYLFSKIVASSLKSQIALNINCIMSIRLIYKILILNRPKRLFRENFWWERKSRHSNDHSMKEVNEVECEIYGMLKVKTFLIYLPCNTRSSLSNRTDWFTPNSLLHLIKLQTLSLA